MQQPQILAAARRILKPFPKLTMSLYKMATTADSFPGVSHPFDEATVASALPASARKIYTTLRSLILETEVTNRTK
jgi:hypothetical protein